MKPLLLILAFLTTTLHAQHRSWRSADGSKSITGKFLKRDDLSVTIMRKDLKHVEIPLKNLNAEDLLWLNQNHPLAGAAQGSATAPSYAPGGKGVIDDLHFGDSRSTVVTKLKNSSLFQATVADTFMARTGLNGIFRSKQTIGGLHCFLFFDWDEAGGLKEITMQTEGQSPTAWNTSLKPCFDEMAKLLTSLHGKPLVANAIPDINSLENGSMNSNYLWNLEPQGSVLLGPSKADDKLHVSVRFTATRIEAQPTPTEKPPEN